MSNIFVPVVDQEHRPLMPTTPSRARRWIRSGKATQFWKGGVFCVRLNREPSARERQPIAMGVDPGSKREGIVVASAVHTYLNIQAEACTGVKEAEKDSTRMRRTRRGRKTPCRKSRQNRKSSRKKLPPSTRARWHWKLRLATFLCQLFPVCVCVVEDIKARTTGKKRWDQSFSPLEVGKAWFYEELGKLAAVQIKQGYETKQLREQLGLKKTGKKLAEVWEAHCIDAWILAHSAVGGRKTPDNRRLVCIAPLNWHHRQLHRFEPEKRDKRKPYGGTLSQSIKRGTLVKHPRWSGWDHGWATESARPPDGQAIDSIGQSRGLSSDEAVTMEDAACAPLPHHIRNPCCLPSLEEMGYLQAEVFDLYWVVPIAAVAQT